MSALVWTLRDDIPQKECDCHPLTEKSRHAHWCASLRAHGAYYYAGRDLQGHWFMPGIENALRATYSAARRIRKELRISGASPRPLTLERVENAPANSQEPTDA